MNNFAIEAPQGNGGTATAAKPLTIADAHEQLCQFLETVHDYSILLTDHEGRIVIWNAGAEYILGYTAEEMIGQHVSIIFTPTDRANGVHEMERQKAETEGRSMDERWHQRKDGSRIWASGVLMPVRDDSGNLRGFCKILRDLTDVRRVEEARNASHQKDRHIADALQRAMLVPIKENIFPGLAIGTVHEAALGEAEVGGDFFDGFLLGNNTVALAVGDASGKGLAAAVRTTQIKDVLRAFLRSFSDADAAATVSRLNDYLCESKRLDPDADNTEEGFVALSLVLLNVKTGEATFAAAGAEPPVILYADGRSESVEISGLPLGIFPQQDYPERTLSLGPGDTLLLVTDGVTEARSGREFLGHDGMVGCARSAVASGGSVIRIARRILDDAKAFAGGSLHDDACLLLARVE